MPEREGDILKVSKCGLEQARRVLSAFAKEDKDLAYFGVDFAVPLAIGSVSL